MPSKSPKQARTMRAAAHNPDFARKVGIPQPVAKEFSDADRNLHDSNTKPRARPGIFAKSLKK